jgi:3-phenylpropionate/trans-cinnamate dioxygenase ferredoxin reductase subunit
LGAVRTCESLRDKDFAGDIVLLSDEAHPPYDRPPLSKSFLMDDGDTESLALATGERWDELQVDVRLSRRVTALDIAGRCVNTSDGDQCSWDKLVVATGSRPRQLPVLAGLGAVVHLRDIGDAEHLRQLLVPGARVVIVGGGFIGLEVAATGRSSGCEVTVVEYAAVPLARVLGEKLGAWVQRWHEGHGVMFRVGTEIVTASSEEGASHLTLATGEVLDADLVVVGVGVERDTQWLKDAELEVHVGLVCDTAGRTSAADIFGVGDITCVHRDRLSCEPTAHWTATCDQAERVASAVMGITELAATPSDGYFWSSQYNRRLQFVGEVAGDAELNVVAGSVDSDAFVARLERDGTLLVVFGIGKVRDFVAERRRFSELRTSR